MESVGAVGLIFVVWCVGIGSQYLNNNADVLDTDFVKTVNYRSHHQAGKYTETLSNGGFTSGDAMCRLRD